MSKALEDQARSISNCLSLLAQKLGVPFEDISTEFLLERMVARLVSDKWLDTTSSSGKASGTAPKPFLFARLQILFKQPLHYFIIVSTRIHINFRGITNKLGGFILCENKVLKLIFLGIIKKN